MPGEVGLAQAGIGASASVRERAQARLANALVISTGATLAASAQRACSSASVEAAVDGGVGDLVAAHVGPAAEVAPHHLDREPLPLVHRGDELVGRTGQRPQV